MASALAKNASEPSAFNVKRSHTGTMVYETGASHFYAKRSIINITEDFAEVEDDNRRSSIRLRNLNLLPDGVTRFPKLAECAHFHYEFVEFGELKLTLGEDVEIDAQSEQWFIITVACNAKTWTVRRTYESLYVLDKQLHRCIYDRKFSMLPELTKDLMEDEGSVSALGKISAYLSRFSALANNMINCGPVLCWMEMDNRGKRLVVPDNDAAVNIPAVGAAHAVRRYDAQCPDEISFEVGDILSIIDKPPSHESTWWRGKKEFQVGYFPSDFVELIGSSKIPPSVETMAPVSAKPVLNKRGKMTSFLIGFFSSRPNRITLRQTGIMKERVFGCDLGEHLLNSGQDVPLVLKYCAEVLETNGIVDGIYRLCGVASNLQKLRNEFDENRVPDLTTGMYLQDIHCFSSLVKMYFRELPNPLLTYQLYDKFTSAFDANSYEDKVNRLREVMRQLPPPHFRTAEFLFKHLSRMASYHSETSMHYKNLAIVWAPNLLRSKDLDQESSMAALRGAGLQAVVTEFLIASVDEVFSEASPLSSRMQDSGSCSSLGRPKSAGLLSSGTKLLSLEEAQERAFGSATEKYLNVGDGSATEKHQKYLSVGDGPAALTSVYHTVIDLPKDRRKNVRRSVVPNWRSLFAKTHPINLQACIGSQGKVLDIVTDAAVTTKERESIRRIKQTEATRDAESANDLLDGKRLSVSCDAIDITSFDLLTLESPVSKSNSSRPDAVAVSSDSTDSTSFDTLRSFHSASVAEQFMSSVEEPFQAHRGRPSQSGQEQPLASRLPSFRKGSCFTSRPISESSPTESEKHPGCSDERISVDYSRQSVSSLKNELCPEATMKNDSQLHNSHLKPYTKNVEKRRVSSSSDRARWPLSDEQEFLSWKLSKSTGSRGLLNELSPAISRVMPQNTYALSADDDSVFRPDRTESPDMHESCQSLSVIIPATCDIGSIPENIGGSVDIAESDGARLSSLCSGTSDSSLHSKQFVRIEKNQDCKKELKKHKTGSFRTPGNKFPLGSAVSSSFDASHDVDETSFMSGAPSTLKHSTASEGNHWKSSHTSSLNEDQFSSVASLESGSVEVQGDRCSFATRGKDKRQGISTTGGGRGFNGQDSSKCHGSSGNEDYPEYVTNKRRKGHLTSMDSPLNKRDGIFESPSTVSCISAVRQEVNLVMPLPVYVPEVLECPCSSLDGGSVSEVDQKFKRRDHVSDQMASDTCSPSSSQSSVPTKTDVQAATQLTSMQNSPSHMTRPDCLSFQKCDDLAEQSESPLDDVFLNSIDASAKSLHPKSASNHSAESLPVIFPVDKYQERQTNDSPLAAEKEFSCSVSFSPSSASSDLRSPASRLPATEGPLSSCDQVSSSTSGSTTDAGQRQRKPRIPRKADPSEPTSAASEFFSESENSSRVGLDGLDEPSADCTAYAEILRRRSSRRSDPPEVREKLNAYTTKSNDSFSSSNPKPEKHSNDPNFGQ